MYICIYMYIYIYIYMYTCKNAHTHIFMYDTTPTRADDDSCIRVDCVYMPNSVVSVLLRQIWSNRSRHLL